MKYLYQFAIIMAFTFLGETLNRVIPLPIPAAVYGLLLLFLALRLRIVKLEQIKSVGDWMIGIMGILFVTPTVNIMGCWDKIVPHLLPIGVIVVVSTVVVFAVAGLVTRLFTRKEDDHG